MPARAFSGEGIASYGRGSDEVNPVAFLETGVL
jgi:hypothetical protein